MRYASTFSGIEAASVAWAPLGWELAWLAEIDPFANAVLAHRFPGVPNLGDIRNIGAEHGRIDLLVGGSPCQSFSIAGLRGGLDDERGNLALEFLRLAQRLGPRWIVWENVPGVLSSNGGRDFGTFLGALEELGYGWAYRVLDARFFGVPQRRRRVIACAYLGDWRPCVAALFEPPGLRRDPEACGQTEEASPGAAAEGSPGAGGPFAFEFKRDVGCADAVTPTLRAQNPRPGTNIPSGGNIAVAYSFYSTLGSHGGGICDDDTAPAVKVGSSLQIASPPAVAYNIHGFNSSAMTSKGEAEAAFQTDVARCLDTNGGFASYQGGTLVAQPKGYRMVAFGEYADDDTASALKARDYKDATDLIVEDWIVRRLSVRECERLQAFPDDWTDVPFGKRGASDAQRYKAVGNSMATVVMHWVGRRIDAVDRILHQLGRI